MSFKKLSFLWKGLLATRQQLMLRCFSAANSKLTSKPSTLRRRGVIPQPAELNAEDRTMVRSRLADKMEAVAYASYLQAFAIHTKLKNSATLRPVSSRQIF